MYKIKLPVFEGPFDLLLYLIRKNEIDIYDIPITQIAHEYLEYIKLMKIMDLEIAGEFIEMVATLMLIKTRTLIPRSTVDEQEEIEDPRLQLTLRLLEYKKFKEITQELSAIETERRQYFPRRTNVRKHFEEQSEEEFLIDATLFDLIMAFKRALDNMPKITVHQVKRVKVTLKDQVQFILKCLQNKSQVFFSELIEVFPDKIYRVVTFMAILDLIKLNIISAKQSEVFEDIRLVPMGEISMAHYARLRGEAGEGTEGGTEV